MEITHLTRCEAEVMDIIWSFEPVTVQDVVDKIERDLAYTTVMTTIKILEAKGVVERTRKRGRAFLYRSLVSRELVRHTMASELKERLFGGSIKSLVLSLVNAEQITPHELAEIRSAIASLEASE